MPSSSSKDEEEVEVQVGVAERAAGRDGAEEEESGCEEGYEFDEAEGPMTHSRAFSASTASFSGAEDEEEAEEEEEGSMAQRRASSSSAPRRLLLRR